MVFSESHQSEVHCCHAGMADQCDSFSGCSEIRLAVTKSFGSQIDDAIRAQGVCACHVDRNEDGLRLQIESWKDIVAASSSRPQEVYCDAS